MGINTWKLRSSDYYVNYDKEAWAREISQRYGTQYHPEYVFQKNNVHFWLTYEDREIYNPKGLGNRN